MILRITCIEFSRNFKKKDANARSIGNIKDAVSFTSPSSRSPEHIAMNELLENPITEAREEIIDVAENVESIEAPHETEFAEPVTPVQDEGDSD